MPFIIAGGAVLAAGIGAAASSSAAGTAANAAQGSARLAQEQAAVTRNSLFPYDILGQNAANQLQSGGFGFNAFGQTDLSDVNAARNYFGQAAALGSGPGAQAALEQTPGYQFARNQGLQATQNAAAARGLGVSGAALKGAATFATGLADQTYTNQFNKLVQSGQNSLSTNTAAQGNLTNTYNRLADLTKIGENATAQTGITDASLTNQAGNSLIAAGNATAAGISGAGNAISGNINSGVSNFLLSQAIQNGTLGGGQPTGAGVGRSTDATTFD